MIRQIETTLVASILVALLMASGPALGRRQKCPEERERQMDACAARMGFLGDKTFRVPQNQTSMGAFCGQLKESLACMQSYSRDCLEGFTRQLMGSLMKRGKQQHSLICGDDTTRRDFMQKMACLSGSKIEGLFTCMDASIGRYELIASNQVDNEAKLPSLCCSYHLFQRDLEQTLASSCPKSSRGGRGSTGDYVAKIVSGTMSQFTGLLCESHRTLQECKTSAKTSGALEKLDELTGRVLAGKAKPKNKSLVPVLLEILDAQMA